jgi:hypothetical protein
MLTYFTNWTLQMTTIFVLGSLLCSSRRESKPLLAVTQIAFEASMFMNLIVLVVYWSLIHAEEITKFSGWAKFHMYTVHIVPTVAFLINWACTDVVLHAGHGFGLNSIGLLYAIVNCIQTKRTGTPLYSFLTWEDYTSPLFCLGLMIAFKYMWLASVSLTIAIKPRLK